MAIIYLQGKILTWCSAVLVLLCGALRADEDSWVTGQLVICHDKLHYALVERLDGPLLRERRGPVRVSLFRSETLLLAGPSSVVPLILSVPSPERDVIEEHLVVDVTSPRPTDQALFTITMNEAPHVITIAAVSKHVALIYTPCKPEETALMIVAFDGTISGTFKLCDLYRAEEVRKFFQSNGKHSWMNMCFFHKGDIVVVPAMQVAGPFGVNEGLPFAQGMKRLSVSQGEIESETSFKEVVSDALSSDDPRVVVSILELILKHRVTSVNEELMHAEASATAINRRAIQLVRKVLESE